MHGAPDEIVSYCQRNRRFRLSSKVQNNPRGKRPLRNGFHFQSQNRKFPNEADGNRDTKPAQSRLTAFPRQTGLLDCTPHGTGSRKLRERLSFVCLTKLIEEGFVLLLFRGIKDTLYWPCRRSTLKNGHLIHRLDRKGTLGYFHGVQIPCPLGKLFWHTFHQLTPHFRIALQAF